MAFSISVPKKQLQNYLINRSFLVQKAESVHEVLEKLKCIQVDPINVVVRSHELALWNRVKDFRLQDLSTHLYKNRSLFEYWLQLFSIIPTIYYPYLYHRMKTGGRWQKEFSKKYAKEITKTLMFIEGHGVTGSKELLHIPTSGSLLSWSDSSRTAVLEYLWDRGKIMIHHREKNQKFYDLTQRVLSEESIKQSVSKERSLEFFLESAFDYTGILRRSFATHVTHRLGYVDTFAVGDLWSRWISTGKIIELTVPEVKTKYYLLRRQLEELKRSGKAAQHEGLNILSPLDPLIIDRQILKDFFDFNYTWEAYMPPAKRKFGYYGMPILDHGKFVGQVDARKNKKGRVEVVKMEIDNKDREAKRRTLGVLGDIEEFVAGEKSYREQEDSF